MRRNSPPEILCCSRVESFSREPRSLQIWAFENARCHKNLQAQTRRHLVFENLPEQSDSPKKHNDVGDPHRPRGVDFAILSQSLEQDDQRIIDEQNGKKANKERRQKLFGPTVNRIGCSQKNKKQATG